MTTRNKKVWFVANKGSRNYNKIMMSGGGFTDLFKKKEKVKVTPIDSPSLQEKINKLSKRLNDIELSLTHAYMENYHMGTHRYEIELLEKEKKDILKEARKIQRLGIELELEKYGNTPIPKRIFNTPEDLNKTGIPPEVSDIINDYTIDF